MLCYIITQCLHKVCFYAPRCARRRRVSRPPVTFEPFCRSGAKVYTSIPQKKVWSWTSHKMVQKSSWSNIWSTYCRPPAPDDIWATCVRKVVQRFYLTEQGCCCVLTSNLQSALLFVLPFFFLPRPSRSRFRLGLSTGTVDDAFVLILRILHATKWHSIRFWLLTLFDISLHPPYTHHSSRRCWHWCGNVNVATQCPAYNLRSKYFGTRTP